MKNDAEKVLQAFKTEDSSIQKHLDNAARYVIFPNVGKGAYLT